MSDTGLNLSRRGLLALGGAATVSMTSRSVSAEGKPTAKLFSTDSGEGLNVVFLHGWTCDSHDWIWQLPQFGSRYRVIAPDLRGHGRSEIMPSGAYLPDDYVADVEAMLTRAGPGQRFVAIGHSMGGQIAARLAA